MKLTPIGTLADSESGVDYYRLSHLFDTDDHVVPSLQAYTCLADVLVGKRGVVPDEQPIARVEDELEHWLAHEHSVCQRGCNCSHDCCGHRFYHTPELLPDLIRDEFIVAHSWGINV